MIVVFFYDDRLIARVMYKSGKPYKITSFENKKLTDQQLFILEYEKQPQSISESVRKSCIKRRKKEMQNKSKTPIIKKFIAALKYGKL